MLNSYGDEKSKSLFVFTTEGQFPAFPSARSDNTHLSPKGASTVAKLVAVKLRTVIPALSAHVHN